MSSYFPILTAIFPYILVFVGMAVILAIATRWAQGFFYENVVSVLTWRSVVVAAAVTAFFGAWAVIERNAPGKFDSLFNFSARDDKWVPYFWAEKKGTTGAAEAKFSRRGTDYYDDANHTWRRAEA